MNRDRIINDAANALVVDHHPIPTWAYAKRQAIKCNRAFLRALLAEGPSEEMLLIGGAAAVLGADTACDEANAVWNAMLFKLIEQMERP